MAQSPHSKSIIYALVLATGMSFLFPEVAFSASRSSRRSGKFSASAVRSAHRVEGIRLGFGRVQGTHRFGDSFDRSRFQSRVGGAVGFIGGTSSTLAMSSLSSYPPQRPYHPQRPPHRENLPKPEHTCTHNGWTAVTAWRS